MTVAVPEASSLAPGASQVAFVGDEHIEVSRDELLTRVWGYDRSAEIETRTVDIHVAKLRRKIEVDAKEPRSLITVRGAGYRLLVSS